MSKYKEIKGFKVQTLAQDTAASVASTGSWSSGGNLNTAREDSTGAGANAEAALMIAGFTTTRVAVVESYNGSSWTEVGDLNVAKYLVKGTGTNTAALAIGGNTPAPAATGQTETWNGSSWTEVADLNVARQNMGGTGTTTASIAFGGNPGQSALAETWNGSSWTEVGDLNTGRNAMASIGTTSTAALAVDGSYPQVNNVESWNGSSWTEIAENNTARYQVAGSGSTTEGLIFGGRIISTPPAAKSALTESWNGSAWTEVADLATARGGGGEAQNISSSTSALYFGGGTPAVNVTEEWTATPAADFTKINLGQVYYNSGSNAFKVTQQLAPAGTWSSGGDLNAARYRCGGAVNATQNAGLVFGGNGSPYGQTEEYNGTAWSEQNDLNTGRNTSYGGAGTQTACVTAGGYNPAGSPEYVTVLSETYNGTSWTEGNDLNEGRIDTATFGTSTAGVLAGGGEGPGGPNTVSSVEIYDGTSWTETTNLPTVTQEMGSLGVSTAGLVFGGSVDSNPTTKNTTVEWDGTSWTAGGTYPISVRYTTAFGSLTNGIAAGGYKYPTAYSGVCNVYNGTSWSEVAELTTARLGSSGNGTGAAGFVAGGEISTGSVASTEEWTVPETNKTITVS